MVREFRPSRWFEAILLTKVDRVGASVDLVDPLKAYKNFESKTSKIFQKPSPTGAAAPHGPFESARQAHRIDFTNRRKATNHTEHNPQ